MKFEVSRSTSPAFTNTMKRQTFIFLLLALLCGPAFGQKEKAKKHTCRILFLERPSSAPATLHLFDGVGSREVALPSMNLSRVYELPAGNLSLALLPAPLANPKELPPGAPTALIPEGVTDFYLLLVSDPSNTVAPVRMMVVNAGFDQFGRGHTLWFNLTSHLIGGKLGTEKLVIQPQSRSTTRAPASENVDYSVNLGYRKADSKEFYPICETRWVHDPRSRNVGFIFMQEGSRTPRVLVFPDFREEQEEKKDAE